MLEQSQNQTGKTLTATQTDIEKTVRRIHDVTWNIKRLERNILLLKAILTRNNDETTQKAIQYVTHERLLRSVQKKEPEFWQRLSTEWSQEKIEEILENLLPTKD